MVFGRLWATLQAQSRRVPSRSADAGSRRSDPRVPGGAGTGLDGAGLPPPPAARFPLRVERGRRHLVDAAGAPFLLLGDSAWSLIPALKREDAEHYLSDRRARGMNAVLANLVEHHFLPEPPRNACGDPPFLRNNDFTSPNERYFAHADHVIRAAADRGLLVLLAPAYLGFGGGEQGWYQEMKANGAARLRQYGQYLGRRYKHFQNILWVDGGDYNAPDKSLVRAIADGILDEDAKPHTYHGARGTAALQLWGPGESWLTVNNIYTDASTVVIKAFAEYERSTMPFFLVEAIYEGEGASELEVRVQAYQAMLSGSMGQVMGNRPVYGFGPGWAEALDSPGACSMRQLAAVFATRAWWTLQPDMDNAFLTVGVGSGQERAVAACAGDGSFAIAYTPDNRSLRFDLSRLKGPNVEARWVDPAGGAATAVTGFPLPASGVCALRPPGDNSSGFGDWVLTFDSIC